MSRRRLLRPRTRGSLRLARLLGRSLALIGLWLLLAGLEPHDPGLAAAAIVAAIATATRFDLDREAERDRGAARKRGAGPENRGPAPVSSLRLGALIRFVPYFVGRSLISGVDVAARAFRARDEALDPALIEHRTTLPDGSAARVLLAGVISLIPGTLCVTAQGSTLTVHVLDRRRDPRAQLRALEHRIAALFGLPQPAQGPGQADEPDPQPEAPR